MAMDKQTRMAAAGIVRQIADAQVEASRRVGAELEKQGVPKINVLQLIVEASVCNACGAYQSITGDADGADEIRQKMMDLLRPGIVRAVKGKR